MELLECYRPRLRRMVALRLDSRLRGRVDVSDIIQEGYLDAIRRLDEFIRDPSVPFYIWLRFLVGQRVQEQHRRHFGTRGRDIGREVSIYRGAMPGATTGELAARLLGKLTSPSQAALRAERKTRLQQALNRMNPLDREILRVLRPLRTDDHRRRRRGPGAGLQGGRASDTPGRWSGSRRSPAPLPGDPSGLKP